MATDDTTSPHPLNSGFSSIETHGHTTPEGMLHLSIPVGLPDADVSVTLHVKPLQPSADVDENGWPHGYFDQVPGSMPDLERAPQGDFEQRLPLG
jgi:hypothetical protein